jgi:hypothetical protein
VMRTKGQSGPGSFGGDGGATRRNPSEMKRLLFS